MRRAVIIAGVVLLLAGAAWYLYPSWSTLVPGLGSRTCRITGTITRDGKPLKWKNDKTLPALGASTPRIMLMVVVFPAPLGPRSPRIS